MIQTQLFNIYKFDTFDPNKTQSQIDKQGGTDKITLVSSTNYLSSTTAHQTPLAVNSLAYSHNSKFFFIFLLSLDQIICATMATQNQFLILAKSSDGTIISKQDTFLNQYSMQPGATKILSATFSCSDSSKIAFLTSEGSLQGLFGGHLVIVNMLTKQLEKCYKEPFLSNAGVSFNTNDSMIVTGNSNGDVIVRNLLNPEGNPLD